MNSAPPWFTIKQQQHSVVARRPWRIRDTRRGVESRHSMLVYRISVSLSARQSWCRLLWKERWGCTKGKGRSTGTHFRYLIDKSQCRHFGLVSSELAWRISGAKKAYFSLWACWLFCFLLSWFVKCTKLTYLSKMAREKNALFLDLSEFFLDLARQSIKTLRERRKQSSLNRNPPS